MRVIAISLTLLVLAGCGWKLESFEYSPIVDRIEREGATDASTASVDAIARWLANRPELAKELSDMCASVDRNRKLTGPPAEQRVCDAAFRVAFFHFDAVPEHGSKAY